MPTMKAFLQAEEAEREERKRLESQREAEWKKEEERLRLEEEQKVSQAPDADFCLLPRQPCFVCVCACACPRTLSGVQVFVTPWSVGHQAPLSTEFSGKEYWSRLPFLTPRNLPDQTHISCIPCISR